MNNDLTAHYKLSNDIDCGATTGWNGGNGFVPVGDENGTKFTGGLDGNQHVIYKLYVNGQTRGSSGVGLFGSIDTGGYVGYLGLQRGHVNASDRAGVLAGYNHGTIEYSFTNVPMNGGSFIGGFVGLNQQGTISHSYSRGNVTGTGEYVGGFVGFDNDVISDSFSTGQVLANNGVGGGLVGRLWSGTLTNVFSTSFTSGPRGGALVGESNFGTITNGHWGSGFNMSYRTTCSTDYGNGNAPLNTGCTDHSNDVAFFYDLAHEPYVSFTSGTGLQANTGKIPTFSWHTMPAAPGAPTDLTSHKVDYNTTYFGWTAPVSDGGADITTYNLQYRPVTPGNDANWYDGGTISGTNTTIDNIAAGPIEYRVAASNTAGASEWSVSGSYSVPPQPVLNITTCEQLQAMADNPDLGYTLMNDIDCSGTNGWSDNGSGGYYGFSPIHNFSGELDGNGYTVDGLYINRPSEYGVAPFYEILPGGAVHDVTFTNENVSGQYDVSGLVGYMNSSASIDSVHTAGTVTGSDDLGGIVGNIDFSGSSENIGVFFVTNSSSEVDLQQGDFSDFNDWGGIVGYASLDYAQLVLSNDRATVNVDAANGSNVGGLVGQIESFNNVQITLENSSSTGTVHCAWACGGLIGDVTNTLGSGARDQLSITGSSSTQSIHGLSAVGGLVGTIFGSGIDTTISQSFYDRLGNWNSTALSADGDPTFQFGFVGGLVGALFDNGFMGPNNTNDSTLTVHQSMAQGILITPGFSVGGLVGFTNQFSTTIDNSFFQGVAESPYGPAGLVSYASYGNLSIDKSYAYGYAGWMGPSEDAAGLVGWMQDGIITNSIADMTVPANNATGAVGYVNGTLDSSSSIYLDADGAQTDTCFGGGPLEAFCYVVNADPNDPNYHPNYYFNNSLYTPFTVNAGPSSTIDGTPIWDFSQIWYTTESGMPRLRAIDYPGPVATITSQLPVGTSDTSATFTFTSNESPVTFQCKLDAGTFNECSSPYTLSDLSTGHHTFSVRAINPNQDVGPVADYSWTVVPPLAPEISSCEQLQEIGNYHMNGDFVLTQDINCYGTQNWNDGAGFDPIGDGLMDNSFTGTLDGAGHKILGLFINRPTTTPVGLFSRIDGGSVYNVRLVGGSIAGNSNVGALAGYVGNSNGPSVIHDITSDLDVTAGSTAATAGGLIGSVQGQDNDHIDLSWLSATSNVTGSYEVGGLIGAAYGVDIHESFARGEFVNTGDYTGGLIGSATCSTLTNVYAQADVVGFNYVGGLLGDFGCDTHITNSYATGTVSGTDSVGGLVGVVLSSGHNDNVITNSFTTSNVSWADGGVFDRANGMIGALNAPVTFSNSFYKTDGYPDCTKFWGSSTATVSSGCTGVSIADNPTLFQNVQDNPINEWNFETLWHIESNSYPTLTPIDEPRIDCQPSPLLTTAVSVDCTVLPVGWGITTWEMQYTTFGGSDWHNVALDDPSQASATISGLLPASQYTVRFRFTNDWGTSDWGHIDPVTGGDSDHDGKLDTVEAAGPNYGDANGDGRADSGQANVTSWINPLTNKWIVLQTDSCVADDHTSFSSNLTTSIGPMSNDHKDAAYTYPAGVMGFKVHCGTACFTCNNAFLEIHPLCCPAPNQQLHLANLTVSQYFYGDYDAANVVARKYNSVTHTYTTIPGAEISNVTIGGQKVLKITYTITDNGPFDEDAAIGEIADPSGPAILKVGAPNTGLGGRH